MANLSELCASLPIEFVERAHYRERMERKVLERKFNWRCEKRKDHQRLLDYRAREERRAKHHVVRKPSLNNSRNVVRRATMPPIARPETTGEMFHAGKGVLQPKKAKNTVCSERMGTIRPRIVVKRFDNSRLNCVCKSKTINIYK